MNQNSKLSIIAIRLMNCPLFLCKDAGKLTQEVIDSKKKDIEKYFRINGHKTKSIDFDINTGLFSVEI